MRGKRERLARLQEAKERLELAATAERLAQDSKLAKRAEEEQQSGKKKTGRKPASVLMRRSTMIARRTPRTLRAGS